MDDSRIEGEATNATDTRSGADTAGNADTAHDAAASEAHDRPSNYADAMRRRDFARAAALIDSATQAERAAPEVRYARALAALELNDPETALREIDGLDKQHPLFIDEVRSVREQAAKVSHDVTLMGSFVRADLPENKLLLAEAHEKSASLSEAKKLATEVLAQIENKKDQRNRLLLARAHALMARTLEAEGKPREAAAEFKWLAVHAAGVSYDEVGLDRAAHEKMSILDETATLSPQQRLERAKLFSDRGWVSQTQTELDALSDAGHPSSQASGLLAWAVYVSRSDYLKAAELFVLASKAEPQKRIEYLYYEAKSLARSHRDREAIEKYDYIAKLGGKFGEHARYQAARLRMIDGQFGEAARGFSAYLKHYGRSGNHREDAKYSLAVARLANGDFGPATADLSELISASSSERSKAQLLHLKGVALLGSGKREQAINVFNEVIDSRPLSFSALLAEARLKELGEPLPPLIAPALEGDEAKPVHPPLQLNLPEKSWRLNRVGLDTEAELALRPFEATISKQFANNGGEALCETYGLLSSAQRRFQIAQSAAQWNHLRYAPKADTRWEWNCIYPTPYSELVQRESSLRQVPAAFIYGVMRQESAFRPRVVSPADAVGLMQIIPKTAQRIASEISATYHPDLMNSPVTNIRFGAYYLRRLLDMFGNRYELAAAAYNAGPHAVTRWLRAGEALPLDIFVASIPYEETRNYVYRVLGNFARYAYLSGQNQVPLPDLALPRNLAAPDDAY